MPRPTKGAGRPIARVVKGLVGGASARGPLSGRSVRFSSSRGYAAIGPSQADLSAERRRVAPSRYAPPNQGCRAAYRKGCERFGWGRLGARAVERPIGAIFELARVRRHPNLGGACTHPTAKARFSLIAQYVVPLAPTNLYH